MSQAIQFPKLSPLPGLALKNRPEDLKQPVSHIIYDFFETIGNIRRNTPKKFLAQAYENMQLAYATKDKKIVQNVIDFTIYAWESTLGQCKGKLFLAEDSSLFTPDVWFNFINASLYLNRWPKFSTGFAPDYYPSGLAHVLGHAYFEPVLTDFMLSKMCRSSCNTPALVFLTDLLSIGNASERLCAENIRSKFTLLKDEELRKQAFSGNFSRDEKIQNQLIACLKQQPLKTNRIDDEKIASNTLAEMSQRYNNGTPILDSLCSINASFFSVTEERAKTIASTLCVLVESKDPILKNKARLALFSPHLPFRLFPWTDWLHTKDEEFATYLRGQLYQMAGSIDSTIANLALESLHHAWLFKRFPEHATWLKTQKPFPPVIWDIIIPYTA